MAAITDLSSASSIAGTDYLVVAQGATDRKAAASFFVLKDSSGRAETIHIYRTTAGGVWPLKIEGVSTSQTAIEFKDGAGTPNRWLIGSGRDSVSDGIFFVYDLRQTAMRMSIDTTGSMRVNNLAGGGTKSISVDNNGNFVWTPSDATLKTDVVSIAPAEALDVVEALAPVRYNWIDTARFGAQREIGLIAQQVQPHVPEVVGSNGEGALAIEYAKLVPLLIGAIQELTARVAALEAAQ